MNERIDLLAVMDEDAKEARCERHKSFGKTYAESALVRSESARAAVAELIEAVRTFVEWLDREEAGSGVGHLRESSPEAETQWRKWYYENLCLCALAQSRGRAALARVVSP